MKKLILLTAFLPLMCLNDLKAQTQAEIDSLLKEYSNHHLGLRFSSNINYFFRAEDHQLAPSAFTTGILGVFYRLDRPFSSFEAGLNIVYKNLEEDGFSLPGVMQDFSDDQQVGLTAVELDIKVGPRFDWFYPRIGFIMGYRFDSGGFQPEKPEIDPIKKFYLHLPFGAAAILPTNWGSVGFGAYYQIGVSKVLDIDQDSIILLGDSPTGGRWRAVNLEIIVTYGLDR
jgi:hypothetical protein